MFDSIKGEAVLRRVAAFQRSERASVKAHVKLLQSLSITSPLIFDIGAHAGLVSKQYIRFCKRKKLLPKIVAFEPQQSQLPLLQKNLGHHGEIRNLAVGGSGGAPTFLTVGTIPLSRRS